MVMLISLVRTQPSYPSLSRTTDTCTFVIKRILVASGKRRFPIGCHLNDDVLLTGSCIVRNPFREVIGLYQSNDGLCVCVCLSVCLSLFLFLSLSLSLSLSL